MHFLAAPFQSQMTEKRSRFLAFAFPVQSEEEVKDAVEKLKKEFFDARHVCYAYVLGDDGERTRAVDDGEPSGTAGRPILGQIQAAGLTRTLVAVVRYFGGIKLGTGPLGVAYKTSAAEVLALACEADATPELVIERQFRVVAPFSETNLVERTARAVSARIVQRDYTADGICFTLAAERSQWDAARAAFRPLYTLRLLEDDEAEKA